MAQVPVVRTPFSRRSFARALILAWRRIIGATPTKEAAGVIFAHYRFETGDGGYCWNYNIGNCKCTQTMARAGVPYMMLADTWEIVGGKKVLFQPPHPATWFRAFESLDEGMTEHFKLLRNERYASCWPSVEAGDPVAFAYDLKKNGYYTGSEAQYAVGLRAGHGIWMKDPAFDDALADVEAIHDADTQPSLPIPNEPTPFPIVHPRVPLDRPGLDEDELPTVTANDDGDPPDAA